MIMNISRVYVNNSQVNQNELELIFHFNQNEFVLVFHRYDFYLVSLGTTFSIPDFKELNLKEIGLGSQPVVIKEIKQNDNYDTFYIFFTNGYVLRIGYFPDNYAGEVVQGVQTFASSNELENKTSISIDELKSMEIIDFRYSINKVKVV